MPFIRRWLFPILSSTFLFSFLLFFFPFDSGDSVARVPLGQALWIVCTATGPGTQDYTYCFLVPIIVVYLVFLKRKEIAQTPIKGSNWGILWIALGLFIFWLGARAGKQYAGCGGIQIIMLGVIILFFGRAMFRKLLFAWAFVAFAWPLTIMDTVVAFPLRMTVSQLAYTVLNLIGIHCVRSGTAIISAANPLAGLAPGARFQIDIADPCSGIHSLLALLMVSALYSYFCLPRRSQQWTVFLSAIPLSIIGNVARILMLVIGCLLWGPAFALGTDENPSWFHEGCGLLVFAVTLGLQSLLGSVLIHMEKWRSRRSNAPALAPTQSEPIGADRPLRPTVSALLWPSGVVFAFFATMAFIAWMAPPINLTPQAGVMMKLPSELLVPEISDSKFYGLPAPVSVAEHTLLPKDTEFTRNNYDDFRGHEVFFSIVLSGIQQYTIHPPEVCLVAQGWNIVGYQDILIRLNSGHELTVRNLSIQRDDPGPNHEHHSRRAFYMFWYVADGITTSSHLTRNVLTSWDRIVHNRDHRWAYVTAMSTITESSRVDGLNSQQTEKLLKDFICAIVPSFQLSEMPAVGDKSYSVR